MLISEMGDVDRYTRVGLPQWLSSKEPAYSAGDVGSVLGLGRSPGEGGGNPLQCSCLENPMERNLASYIPWALKRVGHYLVTKRHTAYIQNLCGVSTNFLEQKYS